MTALPAWFPLAGAASPSRRRLLVLGAGSMREAAFPVWRAMGLEVVLADGFSSSRYDLLADDVLPLDTRDGSSDIAALTRLARECDGVTTLSDDCQATAAEVAAQAGLPGISPEAAAVARDKSGQRALAERAGMSVPRWRLVRTQEDLAPYWAQEPGLSVLKPIDSAGSSGVLQVATADEAGRQWPVVRMLSPRRTAVIEQHLAGREVCVDAVVVAGEPVYVSVVECEYGAGEGFIATAAAYSHRPEEDPDRGAAARQIRLIARVLRLQDAMVHAEFKIDDGNWSVLEFAFRPGGALVPELTARVGGFHLYRAQALIALGLADQLPDAAAWPASAPRAEIRFLVASGGSVRRNVSPAEVVAGLPDVRLVAQLARTGARVRLPVSEEGRAGYVAGWGADATSLDAQLRTALKRLGEGMGVTVVAPPQGVLPGAGAGAAVP